jgi:CRISPR-associated protein Cas2
MMVLVTYDVSTESPAGKRRLRQVARLCQNFGQRVQFSVFECVLDPAQWARLRSALIAKIEPAEDSLRFYLMGANWRPHVEHVGAKPSYDPEAPLIV